MCRAARQLTKAEPDEAVPPRRVEAYGYRVKVQVLLS